MPDARLEQAHDTFYRALGLILCGQTDAMSELWSHAEDVTYMSPLGDLLVGWAPIEQSWAEQAATLTGGPMVPEEVHFFESETLGVVVGFERGRIQVGGDSLTVNIRATSTYRPEGGAWKMIGHHTDRI